MYVLYNNSVRRVLLLSLIYTEETEVESRGGKACPEPPVGSS